MIRSVGHAGEPMLEKNDAWNDMPGTPVERRPNEAVKGAAAASRSLDATAHSFSGSRRRADASWPLTGRPSLNLFLVWALLMAAVVSGLATYQYVSLLGELARQSDALQAEASRRADQHDAHVTALSAVAQAQQGADYRLLLDVAAPILQFYPRIDEVQLVSLNEAGPVFGTRPLESELAATIRAAASVFTGRPALVASDLRPGHYMIVKRSPNSESASKVLVLAIDAGRLLASDAAFWSEKQAVIRLTMPGGTVLFGPPTMPEAPQYVRQLSSTSQPLTLEVALAITWRDLLPGRALLAGVAGASVVFLLGIVMTRQRTRMRAAERRAELSGMEARLTHASRVNALGEMASGLAHELTQPLTAILAQAQAGRRLLARQDVTALSGALDDMIDQARCAANMLDRFRNWSLPHRQPVAAHDLRSALRNVDALLAGEAARHEASIDIAMPEVPLPVRVDPVEIEQVMFNLLRNALDALTAIEGRRAITARLSRNGDFAVLDVADNGPGVAPELRGRLFTPFTTTKNNGMGLGLALSQRLVERASGEIRYVASENGAHFRVVLPLAPEARDP
ncbi:sensor histidine kinase [Agrobacterium pusense]|uniref:sensor histidine kinase n=1 Tax=Agrobacterium pusense TaxID=648995 RepID=UPI001C6E1BB6|nr:ATP-binding protein [Agrobacterium pusense]MBW9067728.1 GHKL domain-containing protein [Agrobacterium pusense]MBW9082326.1 GHKL domain-containing protein [Agrobacterium pusense]MBW9126508.1 GHKL domain-containing protein [Agrobacterium pusense]MBW9139305.1 GHKL domain-containing protein [Agrobacterium pusense]